MTPNLWDVWHGAPAGGRKLTSRISDADALYRVCDDALYGSSNGHVHVDFERPGDDVIAVIRQAIADVERALPHVRVVRIELDRANIAA